MENGTLPKYQLAPDGVTQAKLAGELFQKELKEKNIPHEKFRICYSPFSRTTQTARIAASVLNIPLEAPRCKVLRDLRERFFGPSFELLSHDKYQEIWALDEKNPFEQPEGGECVDDVASRLERAMALMESEFEGCAVLVVSHGDPLQILQTVVNALKQQLQVLMASNRGYIKLEHHLSCLSIASSACALQSSMSSANLRLSFQMHWFNKLLLHEFYGCCSICRFYMI